MYSCGPPHMANQKQDGQLEHTYSSYVMIQDVTLKTCQRRWMIGRRGERGSGISVLATGHDDDDIYIYIYILCTLIRSTKRFIFFKELFISFLRTYMFLACWFRQKPYVAQGHMNGAANDTRTPSCRFVNNKPRRVSSSFIWPMFSNGSNKLETYMNVKTKKIILKKIQVSNWTYSFWSIYFLLFSDQQQRTWT